MLTRRFPQCQVYAYWALDPSIQFPKMWFQFAEDTPPPAGSSAAPASNLFYGFPALP